MLSFIWLLRDHPWSPPALWILIRNVSHSLENVSNVIHFSDIWSRFFRNWKFSQDFGKTNLSYDLQRSLIGAFGGLLLCSCCIIPYRLLKKDTIRLLRPLSIPYADAKGFKWFVIFIIRKPLTLATSRSEASFNFQTGVEIDSYELNVAETFNF